MHKLIDKYEFLNILREDNTTNIKEPYFSDKLYDYLEEKYGDYDLDLTEIRLTYTIINEYPPEDIEKLIEKYYAMYDYYDTCDYDTDIVDYYKQIIKKSIIVNDYELLIDKKVYKELIENFKKEIENEL